VTQHHDPVHPDDGDDAREPVPTLTTDDEAFLAGLLGSLPPVTMPPDVAAGLDAALARESAERAATGTTEAAEPAPGSATVVPLDVARRRGQRRTRILQAAAAVVLVVAGGAIAVNVVRGGSSSTGGGNTSAGGTPQLSLPVADTGHTYTAQTLDADVQALAAGTLATTSPHLPTGMSGGETTTPSPQASESASTPSTATPVPAPSRTTWSVTALVACLAAVEGDSAHGVVPVAMDQGVYAGQAVLVIVLPGIIDPAKTYSVFIVGPTCGQNADADMLRYESVPKA
jgi:hypothetical protein